MRINLSATISAIFMSAASTAAYSYADAVSNNQSNMALHPSALKQVKAKSVKPFGQQVNKKGKNFLKEPDLAPGRYQYIVRLKDDAVATYDGSLTGYPATRVGSQTKNRSLFNPTSRNSQQLDVNAPEVKAYSGYLKRQQAQFVSNVQRNIGNLEVVTDFQYALNAVVINATQEEAEKMSRLANVAFVERSRVEKLHTDTGPRWIGAHDVWDGSANGVSYQGENMLVGIIDTGINTDHPSFADVGGDGYDHTNPFGAGVYKGDCETDASLCNDKLVGVYSFPDITGEYEDYAPGTPQNGEDHNGHGSHVASTTAGNVLTNVPLIDASGNPSDVVFAQTSGVAPHANIISYQVCRPGEQDAIGFSGCPTALVIASVEQAIIDGVDVLNHSIGAANVSPWEGSKGQAFLSAREAGIIVANSAGNDGPDPETASSNAAAPWVLTVAAYTHDRGFTDKALTDMTGGDTTPPASLSGLAQTGGITASIIYAGDYTNPNDPEGDPAQCLEPFPAGTFSGEIVVCDRGEIARVQKGINAAAGGAAGFVLANIDGGADSVVADNHVIPSIHINAENGNALRTWLASGADHTATITASELVYEDERANIAADFTSRGPNNSLEDVITPSIAAPGVSIWAAYADDQPAGFKEIPDPADYAFLSGTSMASPHIAGAATLLKGLHPEWSPAELQSAMMLTANQMTYKEDGTTPSDFFDMGSGMVNVAAAADVGLVMDISIAEYQAANPAEGGQPNTLNLPSMAEDQCVGVCSWTRTVKATKDGDWTLSTESMTTGLELTVEPASVSLMAGETATVTVTANAAAAESDIWAFGNLVLMSSDETLRMPIAAKPSNGNVPDTVSVTANRNADSYLMKDIQALEITDLTVRSYGLEKAVITEGAAAGDSDNSSAFDDTTDGAVTYMVEVPEGAMRLVSEITMSESPDLDLWVGLDANGDGIPQEDELVAYSATATALEKVDLREPEAGNYWVLVQNWQASDEAMAEEGGMDTFHYAQTLVTGDSGTNLSLSGPEAVAALENFDLRLSWDADMEAGDMLYGAVDLGSSADTAGNLGVLFVDLLRGEDDVQVSSDAMAETRYVAGDVINFSVDVQANFTPEDREYEIDISLPSGLALVEGSMSQEAMVDGNNIHWTVARESLLGQEPTYAITTNATDAMCANPDFGQGGGYIDLAGFGIGPDTGVDGNNVTASYGVPAYFMGQQYASVTVTDDGFLSFGSIGSEPWVNQLMPNADAPNGIVAPLWRDMYFDPDAGATLTVASAGPQWTFLEFDNMQTVYTVGGAPLGDIASFEVAFNNAPADGQPNIIFSYNNVAHVYGDAIPTSIGYESPTGMTGMTSHYIPYFESTDTPIGSVADDVSDDLMVCMYLQSIESAPETLTFSAMVTEGNPGGEYNVSVKSSLPSNVGAGEVEVSPAQEIEVEGPPVALINGYPIYSTSASEGESVSLTGTGIDPNGDDVTLSWTQASGPSVNLAGSDSGSLTVRLPEVEGDAQVRLVLTATEVATGISSEAVVSIKVLNKKESGGSAGFLTLLLLPLLWLRRRKAA